MAMPSVGKSSPCGLDTKEGLEVVPAVPLWVCVRSRVPLWDVLIPPHSAPYRSPMPSLTGPAGIRGKGFLSRREVHTPRPCSSEQAHYTTPGLPETALIRSVLVAGV